MLQKLLLNTLSGYTRIHGETASIFWEITPVPSDTTRNCTSRNVSTLGTGLNLYVTSVICIQSARSQQTGGSGGGLGILCYVTAFFFLFVLRYCSPNRWYNTLYECINVWYMKKKIERYCQDRRNIVRCLGVQVTDVWPGGNGRDLPSSWE